MLTEDQVRDQAQAVLVNRLISFVKYCLDN